MDHLGDTVIDSTWEPRVWTRLEILIHREEDYYGASAYSTDFNVFWETLQRRGAGIPSSLSKKWHIAKQTIGHKKIEEISYKWNTKRSFKKNVEANKWYLKGGTLHEPQ